MARNLFSSFLMACHNQERRFTFVATFARMCFTKLFTPRAVEADVFIVSRGRQPNVTHFRGAARTARCLEQCVPNISPDSLRCFATKVGAMGRQLSDALLLSSEG